MVLKAFFSGKEPAMKKLRMLVLAASVAGIGLMMSVTGCGCCDSQPSCSTPCNSCDTCGTGNDWNYSHGGTR
jgi:hypothetical protein